ncbi:MAG: hypothetical protein HMLKMBBP_00380 [Planctomycetes bacterium]|nr:hypothetical protein [Planctomycetota bacterium]
MMIALLVLGVLVAAVAAGFVTLSAQGRKIPPDHTAAAEIAIRRAQREVWERVRDFAAWHTWAPGVKSVETGRSSDGRERVVLRMGRHAVPLVVEREERLRRLVTRIDDATLPFGGTWTWTFSTDGGACRVRIEEEGVIRSPVLRALAKQVLGYDATIKAHLKALSESFR